MRARCEAAALSQGSFGLRGLYGDDGGEYRGGSVVVSFWWLGRWLGAVVVECGWGGSVVGSIMVVWWCVCGGAAARMSQEEARATVRCDCINEGPNYGTCDIINEVRRTPGVKGNRVWVGLQIPFNRPKAEVVYHTNWISALLTLGYITYTGELQAALRRV